MICQQSPAISLNIQQLSQYCYRAELRSMVASAVDRLYKSQQNLPPETQGNVQILVRKQIGHENKAKRSSASIYYPNSL
jgi:hypothetical protein